MKVNNENEALMDKVSVYGFTVKDIEDIYPLVKQGIVSIEAGKDKYLTTIAGDQYSRITIKNESLFDSFIFGIGSSGHVYGRLDISINNPEDYNLNCFSADEYKQRISDIKDLLEIKYGIYARFNEAKFQYMEINKTIEVDDIVAEYSRVLNLVFSLFPGHLRLKDINAASSYDEDKDWGAEKEALTLRRSSGESGIDITAYDKTTQINRKLKKDKRDEHVDKNYLRFEVHLKSAKKIKDALGTNGVWDIKDKMLNFFFRDFLKKAVMDPYNKYCLQRDKRVRKVLNECYMPGSRTWIRDVMFKICRIEIRKGIPLILDIKELIPLLKILPFNTRQARYNAKKTFLQICRDCPNIFEGDMDKMLEIINKLK